ncbi:protein LTO1 homolog isoform X5 [Lynx rufus]|uniref:protein LTO1 homolog isoform X5 n=1 Tax=Lynx rufus TaxID=61384 RepID=UPI001F122F34|nr:protein LTO1 homolog isoform X5 [Lynx rufus]
MAGSQDVFDAIVMADERFHGEGYQEGYEEGSSLGIIEGRRHGTLHGAKIGSEQRSRQCGWRNVLGTERQSRLLYKDAWSPCALRVLRLVQVEVLWQPRVGQVCWCHCSNSICSLHVSASHFDWVLSGVCFRLAMSPAQLCHRERQIWAASVSECEERNAGG